jgi:hypothetical protein
LLDNGSLLARNEAWGRIRIFVEREAWVKIIRLEIVVGVIVEEIRGVHLIIIKRGTDILNKYVIH